MLLCRIGIIGSRCPIGSHVMNPERYPDPKKMVDELHKANIHGMISIWPVFGNGTKNFDALKKWVASPILPGTIL